MIDLGARDGVPAALKEQLATGTRRASWRARRGRQGSRVFLASAASGYVTGAELVVGGGMTQV